jgi:hypothetical protein
MILNKSKTSQCEEFRIYSKRSENLRMVLFDNELRVGTGPELSDRSGPAGSKNFSNR